MEHYACAVLAYVALATLHVRNVPDDAYEALRLRAERNGRSIAGETVAVLEGALAVKEAERSRVRDLIARRRPRNTRFDPAVRELLARAQTEARELGDAYVGTEHLLLALYDADDAASRALRTLGLAADEVRREVELEVGRSAAASGGSIPLTPRAKKVLELALREALAQAHDRIEPEHVLIAIAREGEGVASRILSSRGGDLATLRGLVIVGGHRRVPGCDEPAEPAFRVVELDGSADEWQERLNAAAEDGYDLVEVVGRRAILRRR